MQEPETPTETKHIVSLKGLSFSTTLEHPPDEPDIDVEAEATDELIHALKTGRVSPRWSTIVRTPEQQEAHAAMDEALRCDHCERVTMEEKRELVVGDAIEYICGTCADELRDKCNFCGTHRDDLADETTMTVYTNPDHSGVVEFVCSDCRKQ